MQPRKHLLATCSVLLMAALLAASAAPAAAPAPPADTPAPPVAESDPVAVAQAWVDAINNGDEDAALALMTDDIDFSVWEYNAHGKENLRRQILDWWVGLDTKYQIVTCESQENQVSCEMNVVDGCIAAFGATEGLPTKMTLVVQEDGKISKVAGNLNGARWNDYFRTWSPLAQSWMQANRAAELRQIDPEPDRKQAGALQIKLCRDYENAVKTQGPATDAAAQSLVDAINYGDSNAALAFFMEADDVSFRVLNDEAQGAEETRAMLDWFASKETQFQISDCEWQGIGTQCAVTLVDGCIAASGVPDGLHGKMTFNSQEDGTLRQVVVLPAAADRKPYQTWLEAETAWASANRADELAQAEGYSQEAGAMAVKLCREYAETLK